MIDQMMGLIMRMIEVAKPEKRVALRRVAPIETSVRERHADAT